MRNEKPGGHGERSVAVGTLDMAVWDAVAKIAGKPLYRLLAERYGDGRVDETVFVYAAGGYYYPGKDQAQLQEEMKGYLGRGYTVEGADLAKDFLAKKGMSERHLEIVWDAIALHTTAEIPSRKCSEVALCQLGIAADLGIAPPDVISDETVDEVLAAYPWLEMHQSLPTALVGLFHKNPKAASSNAVAEACEQRVSGFKRFNLCDRFDRHACAKERRDQAMRLTVNGINLNVPQAGSGERELRRNGKDLQVCPSP